MEAKEVHPQSGLSRITHDRSKDWKHSHRFGAVLPSKLPTTLGRMLLSVDDQDYPEPTSFCTGYGTSKAGSYMYGQDFSPEWQVAQIGEFAGDPILNGADPLTALYAGMLSGFCNRRFAPLSLAKDGAQKVANWNNWPSNLPSISHQYAPDGFYVVDQPMGMDVFDSTRSALYQAKEDNSVVIAFSNWYQQWNQEAQQNDGHVTKPLAPAMSLHCYLFVDWVTALDGSARLVAHLSEGTDYGDKGFLYFDRDAVNTAFAHMIPDGTGLYLWRKKGRGGKLYFLLAILNIFAMRIQRLVNKGIWGSS
jgi:hypothetical protein